MYVPTSHNTDNHLRRLIGPPAFKRLVMAFGGMQIRCVPKNVIAEKFSKRRQVYDLLLAGTSVTKVCEATGWSALHIRNIRREFEEAGLLPVILREPPQ